MGLPVFRFTLSHPNLGTLEIAEPDGWKDAKLILERHPDFHTLVEYFEGSFIFYGEDNVHIGGADFIKQCENLYGVDAEITIHIQATFDNANYETVFLGQLDLSGLEEVQDNKIEVPIIRNSLWAKLIARKDTPVDLTSLTDLDGNAVPAVEPVDVNLPSQTIIHRYEGHHDRDTTVTYNIPDNEYGQIDFSNVILDEIKEKSNLPLLENSERPADLFCVEYGGEYLFDIHVFTSTAVLFGSGTDGNLQVRLQVNDDAAIVLTQTGGTSGLESWTEHNYYNTLTLQKGDLVRLYFYNNNATGASYQFVLLANLFHDTRMLVTGDTVFPSSEGKGYLLHDAFAGVIHRICGVNAFYSEILGRTDTNMRTYASNGCFSNAILMKGLQIRGYSIDEKPASFSLSHLWKGADPMFNLCLGYEEINGTEYIRVEHKGHAYDPTSVSTIITNVRQISRQYDHSKIFNKIEVGFSKWQSENISGNDDPQTKHIYSTRIVKVENTLSLLSDFTAASIAIESTRRSSVKKSADNRFDDTTFIININTDDISPDRYQPETDENFNSITNLNKSHTRYNNIYTPLRSLLRWSNYWNGCLQKYQSSSLNFQSGEGNFAMTSDYSCAGGSQCLAVICDNLSEGQDIPLGSPSNYGSVFGYLHYPQLYNVSIINYSWDSHLEVRNDKNDCIGVSQTLDNYKRFFIKKLVYQLCYSKAEIEMWPFDEAPILIVETTQPIIDYDPPVEEDCGDRVRLLEDGEERITEDGECRNLEDGGTIFFYNSSEGGAAQYFYNDSEIPPADDIIFYNANEL